MKRKQRYDPISMKNYILLRKLLNLKFIRLKNIIFVANIKAVNKMK